jgi:hypothetical protein
MAGEPQSSIELALGEPWAISSAHMVEGVRELIGSGAGAASPIMLPRKTPSAITPNSPWLAAPMWANPPWSTPFWAKQRVIAFDQAGNHPRQYLYRF